MGLDRHSVAFLVAARRLGVSFESTLQIGRALLPTRVNLTGAFATAGETLTQSQRESILAEGGGFAEGLFRHLGGQRIDSLDATDWEQGTIIHDLNEPLPAEVRAQYSAVLDTGTLEHVFDFPTALKNCLEAVSVGGHYLSISPANNWCGHGFYQLSPEVYYRVLAPESGFRVCCLLMRSTRLGAPYYRVSDPAESAVTPGGPWKSLMYTLACRVSDKQILAVKPQQHKYAAYWEAERQAPGSHQASRVRRPRARLVAKLPPSVREPYYEFRRTLKPVMTAAANARELRTRRLHDLSKL
ncbi:MAG: hypothetical protein LC798_03570 [Chloroflexi bacterium]|nr:hypothetical protein [Chloroflexota bacterium]